jgi:hypothetical protein
MVVLITVSKLDRLVSSLSQALYSLMVPTQEAKYVESWPNMTSTWAGWSRFDIPVDRSDGVHSLLH